MQIGKACIDDIQGILELEQSNYDCAEQRKEIDFITAINNSNDLLLVMREVKVVGYIWKHYDEIMTITVLDEYRRLGIGTKLLVAVIENCVGEIFLEVRENNFSARTLYEKNGFLQINTRKNYYNNGENAVIYRYFN